MLRMDREKKGQQHPHLERGVVLEGANRESASREDGPAERHGLTESSTALGASC